MNHAKISCCSPFWIFGKMTLNLYANAQKIGTDNLELFVHSAYKFTFTIVACNINLSIQNNV